MSELLGLSFDGPASPEISFGESTFQTARGGSGWGVAWYPAGEAAAAILRNPLAGESPGLLAMLHDWDRFRTELVIAHLRGAAKRAAYRDTHPFERSFGGRSWVLAHSGDLLGDLKASLPLPHDLQFVPVGSTDTEHFFNWLLAQAAARGAATLYDVGYDNLAALLRHANTLGSLSAVLSDGDDLIAYQDGGGGAQLWFTRRVPPQEQTVLAGSGVVVDLSAAQDANRSLAAISTIPFGDLSKVDGGWTAMAPGQLLVVRRGTVVHDSAAGDPISTVAPRTIAVDGTFTSGSGSMPPPTRPPRRTLEVYHRTTYTYDQPVESSSHRFRLAPVRDGMQLVTAHDVTIKADGTRFDFEDVFGNSVVGFEISRPFTQLTVEARSVVEVREFFDRPDLLPERNALPLVWMPWQRQMMSPYLLPAELPENELRELGEFAESFVNRNRQDLLATLDDVTMTIYQDFEYRPGFTTLETTPFEVYRERAGVCQDFANLMICACRLLNIPARYRVGYIYTSADYENTVQSEASHAWVEVYLPYLGWRGYDPTNGCRAGSDHVRVASGRNYRDATPSSGVIHRGGGGEALDIEVRVTTVESAL